MLQGRKSQGPVESLILGSAHQTDAFDAQGLGPSQHMAQESSSNPDAPQIWSNIDVGQPERRVREPPHRLVEQLDRTYRLARAGGDDDLQRASSREALVEPRLERSQRFVPVEPG